VLATLEAPVYIERVALGNNKMIVRAGRAIKKAIENQVNGLGFSFIEILSPCPTIWKMEPRAAQEWVRDELTKIYPLSVFRDNTAGAEPRPAQSPAPPLTEIPKILGIACEGANGAEADVPATSRRAPRDFRIKIAGFGGQGVLMLGEVLVEAGLAAGLEVSWLPSYGPEMRSGTSNCHVRLCSDEIDSPLVSRPNVLMALNEPSLRKFLPAVEPGGWVLYNGDSLPAGTDRKDVRFLVHPFAEFADRLGDARAGNIVMLGALLEATDLIEEKFIDGALMRLVKSDRWLEIDRQALAFGREAGKAVHQ
jgi:2-oxoisovalerate ferredoxin oxidoreductase beta subunit